MENIKNMINNDECEYSYIQHCHLLYHTLGMERQDSCANNVFHLISAMTGGNKSNYLLCHWILIIQIFHLEMKINYEMKVPCGQENTVERLQILNCLHGSLHTILTTDLHLYMFYFHVCIIIGILKSIQIRFCSTFMTLTVYFI